MVNAMAPAVIVNTDGFGSVRAIMMITNVIVVTPVTP